MDIQILLAESSRLFSQKAILQKDIPLLRDIVREHNRLYYQQESPVISDEEYDRLFSQLVEAERRYGDFDPESPTSRIAVAPDEQFQKRPHATPMLSLDNTYSIEEIRNFEARIRNILKTDEPIAYCIEVKFDGLGISLSYERGQLVRALTRGNGMEGEIITQNIMTVQNIPHTISYKESVEIRGEIILPHDEFTRINEARKQAGEKLFANPRNAASGSVRQLDPKVTKSRKLRFFAYSFPHLEEPETRALFGSKTGISVSTYSQYIAALERLWFETSGIFFERAKNLEALVERLGAITAERPRLGFDIDGLVIKVDDLNLWKHLGLTAHHPRYAIAFKFPAKLARTRIQHIIHSVGRSGIVTPVAILDPVLVGGVTVSRATLHNYSELAAKDAHEGDTIFLMRAGEVIPEVVSVITEARDGNEKRVGVPEKCPACETPLEQETGKIAYFCPNRTGCPAQLQGGLETFAGKHGMNIDGLGKKQIERFRREGFISDMASIYHLYVHRETLVNMQWLGEKSVENLLTSIENSRHVPLHRLLTALGIPNIGRRTAQSLAIFLAQSINRNDTEKPTGERLLKIFSSLSAEDLESIPDMGPVASQSVFAYFTARESTLSRLFPELHIILPDISFEGIIEYSLSEKTFCITGSFDGMTREQIIEIAKSAGMRFVDSVSKKLDMLVVGEKPGSKLQKAKSLGIPTMGIEEFLAQIRDHEH